MSENWTGCVWSTSTVKEQPQFTASLDAINKQSEIILELATSIIEKLQWPALEKDSEPPIRMWYIWYMDRIEDKLNHARELLYKTSELL